MSEKARAEGRNILKLLAKISWYKEREEEAAGEAESDGDGQFDRYLIINRPRRAGQCLPGTGRINMIRMRSRRRPGERLPNSPLSFL